MKKLFIVIPLLFAVIFGVAGCVAQNTTTQKAPKGAEVTDQKVDTIPLGNTLPQAKAADFQMGDLYTCTVPNEVTEHMDIIGIYKNEYYSNKDASANIHIGHIKNTQHQTLTEFTQQEALFYALDETSWAIGPTYDVCPAIPASQCGYMVKFYQAQAAPKISQTVIVQDGEDMVMIDFMYFCQETKVGDTDITISIPMAAKSTTSGDTTTYTTASRNPIPEIIISSKEGNFVDELKSYREKYNCRIGYDSRSNRDYGHCVLLDFEENGKHYNERVWLFSDNGKVYTIIFREPADKLSYALSAILGMVKL
ncbi:MAG: hypothetical protein Q4E88_02345 [Coriobacteriia bacterium]|nr:hypothetical protein [Coriobacteriia bacterium]